MHEVGIMRQALALALEAAQEAGASRVTRIRLEIGQLAGVVPGALEFAFEAVTNETIAKGAVLEWSVVPVLCNCQTGCAPFNPESIVYRCPVCGVISTDIAHGRELRLSEIDVLT